MNPISRERAEVIARAHDCSHCHEYNYKKVQVRLASEAQLKALQAVWVVKRVCGICGLESEMGLDADGDIVFLG